MAIRVHELAKSLGLTTKEVVEQLRARGVEVKSNLSVVDEQSAALLSNATAGAPPRAATAKAAAAAPKPAARATKPMAPARAVAPRVASVTPRAVPAPKPSAAPHTPPAPAGPAAQHVKPAARAAAPVAAPHAIPTRAPSAAVRTAPPATAPPRPARATPAAPPRLPAPSVRTPVAEPGAKVAPPKPAGPPREITVTEGVTVRELSEKMEIKTNDVLKKLLMRGVVTTVNRPLDLEVARQIALEFNHAITVVSYEESEVIEERKAGSSQKLPRSPVVTVMGHVDHGKTSLLDAIRETRVVDLEHGGITQHIGAYSVAFKNRTITFLDTPGHEAFTLMRARGARVTDVVILVVAADDGVMPQTIEAIDHARAAGVPIVVAINKIDKPEANVDRVKKQLADRDLLVEDWGGQVVCVLLSAKQKQGISDLLEMILLVADMQDLRADPSIPASGTVLEARLDRSRGPVATVLVRDGTLRISDAFIAGAVSGKVRAMFDDAGGKIEVAGPSAAVEVLGLQGVPQAGDIFKVLAEEWKARQIGAFRQQKIREDSLQRTSRMTLNQLFEKIQEGTIRELPLVLKADVQGSLEALNQMLGDLPTEKIKLRVIRSSTGAISESDVLLATTTNAIVIGFNVRPERKAAELAEKENVDIRLHTVVYDVTSEIRAAMVGLLEPTIKEVFVGRAEVRDTFSVPKFGIVAGCMVTEGRMTRNAQVRLLRDNVVVYSGRAASLRRFKDDVNEVKSGFECGIGLEKYNDVKPGDIIEAYKTEKVANKELSA